MRPSGVRGLIVIVSVKPLEGKGPMTAPSVQQDAHLQLAVKVPSAAFHELTSPGSSLCTTAGGVLRPVNPVLVAVILSPFCEFGMALLPGASSEITRYTSKFASITRYTAIALAIV